MQLPSSLPRRRVFVSYHHAADSGYYGYFLSLFAGAYEIVHDHSVDRIIESDDPDYVIRRIREDYLRGASVTIVLCGRNTFGRKYVDWEILASLNQEMGLVGLNLPTNLRTPDGNFPIPPRLYDSWFTGYASMVEWGTVVSNPDYLPYILESSLWRSRTLIDNGRSKRLINAPLR